MAASKTQFVKTILRNWKGFDRVVDKVKILNAGNGECKAEFKVEEEHTNPMGSLHGGFSATLVDVISSCALLTHPRGECPSVSVDMNLTYLKGANLGDEVLVDAKTLKAGKTLAFLEVEIFDKTSGQMLVKGRHTKFLLNSS